MKKTYLALLFPVLATGAYALNASDDASNYTSVTWVDGSNFGTGFGTWSFNNNDDPGNGLFAGRFLGSSTDGAGDINTGTSPSQSFGMYANPNSVNLGTVEEPNFVTPFSTASRTFSSALSVNDQFSFDFALQNDNGNKGFNVFAGGAQAFGFNVGFGAQVNTAFTNNSSIANYDFGGGDAMLQAVLTVLSTSSISYEIRRTSGSGLQGILFSGTISGITNPLDSFEFYISGTDGGGSAANNLYFNSLSVSEVPEPSAFALLAGCLALATCLMRRR